MKKYRLKHSSLMCKFILMWIILASTLGAVPVSASSIKHMQVDDMLQASELVFEGQVIASEARWNASGTQIHTYITFQVNDVIVGSYEQAALELRFVGGTVGDDTVQVDGLAYPTLNEQGIYFVETLSRNLVNPLVGWSQGHFLVKKDAGGNELVMTQDNAAVMSMTTSKSTGNQPLLSNGVAGGLKVKRDATPDELAHGMSKQNFKQQLKSRMAALRAE